MEERGRVCVLEQDRLGEGRDGGAFLGVKTEARTDEGQKRVCVQHRGLAVERRMWYLIEGASCCFVA
jgi:hypothetical protein